MTHHVVCLAGAGDPFVPEVAAGDSVLRVPFGDAADPEYFKLDLESGLYPFGLVPQGEAVEFLHAAVGAYTADVRTPRRSGFDGWTRQIALYLPSVAPERWNEASGTYERLLGFLTGDKWTVAVRPAHSVEAISFAAMGEPSVPTTAKACLFSGGLDSYAGAAQLLANGADVVLVGHGSQGSTRIAQGGAVGALRQVFGEERTPYSQFWILPPKGAGRASADTTRGRSVLFVALGALVASSLASRELVVPENGVISLNVPLTGARLGSFSTRTTHPHLMDLFRAIFTQLGLDVSLTLPYRFKTKGEMLLGLVGDGERAGRLGLSKTMSCARPDVARWQGSGPMHCGYCLPCLIRRAAVLASGWEDDTKYFYGDLANLRTSVRKADLRAVRFAIDRFSLRPPAVADVLVSGPLNPAEAGDYVGVFSRGLSELAALVGDIQTS